MKDHRQLWLLIKEQLRTGINFLKIRYNQVHGHGIEITTPHLHLVPAGYLRTQTLANRERFTTQELKYLEYDLQKARTEIHHVEKRIFEALKEQVETSVPALKKLSWSLLISMQSLLCNCLSATIRTTGV